MNDIIDLDTCVLNALELFEETTLPSFESPAFDRPLVVGSGNAAVTGKIIFRNSDAVFADESTFRRVISTVPSIDGAVLISASGGKHAPTIAEELGRRSIPTVLLTNNQNAIASSEVNQTLVFPKAPEPYTYNTSTYLGMILAHTGEDPTRIKSYIEKHIDPMIPTNLSAYDAFFIIVPNRFDTAREMFMTKFDELFGAAISGRVYTEEQTKHAKTIVPYSDELFVGIGYENNLWGANRLDFELPESVDYGAFIAIGYYIIGKIQKQNPPFFKYNLENYVRKISKLFGETITPIV